jgi:hypothetical protein
MSRTITHLSGFRVNQDLAKIFLALPRSLLLSLRT